VSKRCRSRDILYHFVERRLRDARCAPLMERNLQQRPQNAFSADRREVMYIYGIVFAHLTYRAAAEATGVVVGRRLSPGMLGAAVVDTWLRRGLNLARNSTSCKEITSLCGRSIRSRQLSRVPRQLLAEVAVPTCRLSEILKRRSCRTHCKTAMSHRRFYRTILSRNCITRQNRKCDMACRATF